MSTKFYVYAYIRSASSDRGAVGTPYYIGKGTGYRAWHRSNHKHITVPQDKRNIIIVSNNLTNFGAQALERWLIRWYGRIDQHTGCLRNRTDGGEGTSGWTHSNDTKRRMSRSHSLNSNIHCHTDDHKQLLKHNLRKTRALLTPVIVRDIRTRLAAGDYTTLGELALEYGVSKSAINGIKHNRVWKDVAI